MFQLLGNGDLRLIFCARSVHQIFRCIQVEPCFIELHKPCRVTVTVNERFCTPFSLYAF